ncbi:zinc-ribbon domain-containing protein [Micromonospora echinofusca]|uniref:Zinc-ribbon domain-containing protein n=1 Tax=Micromonospora echinofusca TaxID=47858 RepID=A0ABS3VX34_MICEH|nr:zinc ribbon domain-containing protein [Micromonospora echinofusca]MBO4209099.1 zinc-ribbon domain-containing protein [Micromonospora echinofusca]
MFFIFGLRTGVHRLGVVHLVCRNCGNTAAQVVTRRTTRFSLFFVPLFPVRTRYGMQCSFCGAAYDLPKGEAVRLAGQ